MLTSKAERRKGKPLLRLRPVTFRYKQPDGDGSKPIEYGLIAEEVADVYPDLVTRNAAGEIEAVQYHKLTPMLLNELGKEHKADQAQELQLRARDEALALLQAQVSALQAALEKLIGPRP